MVYLILFDIDGTLLHAGGVGRAAKQQAVREVFGVELDQNGYSFGGKTDWHILADLLAPAGFSVQDVGQHMAQYQAAFAQHTAQMIVSCEVRACPGAHELLASLRARDDVLPGIITGNTAATTPIKLRAAGFAPEWFPVGAYGSESPDRNELSRLAWERGCAHLGQQIAPQQVIIIGDTAADVACARAVGAVAVAVRTGFAQDGELEAAAPDYLLDDLRQFGQVLAL